MTAWRHGLPEFMTPFYVIRQYKGWAKLTPFPSLVEKILQSPKHYVKLLYVGDLKLNGLERIILFITKLLCD